MPTATSTNTQLPVQSCLMEILPDRCTMIAKKELIYAGTVGLICWLGGIVFINRKKTSDAKSVMAGAAKTMLDDQIRLWVFPEGTRNQRGDLLPFKKGAFHLAVQAQAPIIPVVFSSYSNFYLRKEKQFKSGTIRLKILPKIETKGMTSEDVSSLSDKSFNVMRSAFLEISDSVTQSNGPLSVLSPFLHSSLLPKDKRSGVSTSSGVRGGERSTPVDRGLL
ncbi:1-acyl-sn-glycerol-3-phosphate acyltransferase alpha-like protein [Lates japonicus]|uniref:1-acylglycerol-3-phosphate O-acyltransferase n=1 Tax=Lates japonicus TaxID=270547 RepID=A0AAD3MD13_LATJO|nr:1-acyl-sn-glycerol-3-phosphate acyltransferase alpha-like protein [Lates japonicus]